MQQEEEELSSKIFILDDLFEQQDNDLVDNGDRALQTSYTYTSVTSSSGGTTTTTTTTTNLGTCGFTSATCNQQKALFNQTFSATLGNVASACAAAVTASFTMQCLLLIKD
jgi:hypothetical protein